MSALWLIAGVPAAVLAGLVLLGASGGRLGPALIAVLLPALSLAVALRPRLSGPGALGVALLAWGAAVWIGAPAWVDRVDALHAAGLSAADAVSLDALLPGIAASPRGDDETSPRLADCDCLGEEVGAVAAPPSQPVVIGDEDLVVLPYEGTRSSMRLPVSLEWDGREVETELIFDTGATLTSIKPELLEALGYRVPADAPTITMQTANGRREASLLLLDRVWLGGFAIEHVSVVACDKCGHLNGLLGLNVSGNFRVEVDQANQELIFRPEAEPSRALDVQLWLRLGLQERGERFVVAVRSEAPLDISAVTVEVRCDDVADEVALGALPAGEEVHGPVSAAVWCDAPKMSVIDAQW